MALQSKGKIIIAGVPLQKIIIYYIGIDIGKFEYLKRNKHQRKPIKILTSGRLVKKKAINMQ